MKNKGGDIMVMSPSFFCRNTYIDSIGLVKNQSSEYNIYIKTEMANDKRCR